MFKFLSLTLDTAHKSVSRYALHAGFGIVDRDLGMMSIGVSVDTRVHI